MLIMESIIEEKKPSIWLKENLSMKDAGCIGGGKGPQADCLKVGVNRKLSQLLPSMLGKETNVDF
jgi:hypothetical protein